jgi:hypothetical protein
MAGDSIYPGIYLRPNYANRGTVPASNPLDACSDIWVAGTQRLANFQTVLATNASYAPGGSGITVQPGQTNYIYVRGANATGETLSTQVKLFVVPSNLLQWPSFWQEPTLPTDSDTPSNASRINDLAPGTIGVAQHGFVWANPGSPPPGSTHYCLIAWLDNNGANPFPGAIIQLNIAALITNNLGFGWLGNPVGN